MRRQKRYQPVIYRTRFGRDIIAEVALPERGTGKVIVLAPGSPATPYKRQVLEFLVGEGYAVVFPRYRGTWESGGYFLEHPPTQDIRDVIETLQKEQRFWCTFSQVWIPLRAKNFYLIGSSFGGPAVLTLSELKAVKKVVALSPVIDWQAETPTYSLAEDIRFTEEGFGMATRLRSKKDWQKLLQGDFYSFPKQLSLEAKKKVFLIHCFDDAIVPIGPAIEAVETKKILQYYFKPHGGHLGLSSLTQLFFWHKIQKFLKTK